MLLVAVLVAALAGVVLALIHAFVTITMRANQIVSGLTLTIFAGVIGLSSYIGDSTTSGGKAGKHQFTDDQPVRPEERPGRSGRSCSTRAPIVYLSWLLVILRGVLPVPHPHRAVPARRWASRRRRPTPWAINVTRYRYVHTLIGGALAGVAARASPCRSRTNWIAGHDRGRRLDRHRAGDLLVLAARAADPRRVPVRRVLRHRVRPPGARRDCDPVRVLVGPAVHHDDRRAGAGVGGLGPAPAGEPRRRWDVPYVREES